jgi:hypothetical protein
MSRLAIGAAKLSPPKRTTYNQQTPAEQTPSTTSYPRVNRVTLDEDNATHKPNTKRKPNTHKGFTRSNTHSVFLLTDGSPRTMYFLYPKRN